MTSIEEKHPEGPFLISSVNLHFPLFHEDQKYPLSSRLHSGNSIIAVSVYVQIDASVPRTWIDDQIACPRRNQFPNLINFLIILWLLRMTSLGVVAAMKTEK